ncbi:MAG: tetratricopeptide repeat protein [Verrucomicrobiales bacterium]|nr:tetratricopeptide repeat protein [Verrucomicrobiales bacterium]
MIARLCGLAGLALAVLGIAGCRSASPRHGPASEAPPPVWTPGSRTNPIASDPVLRRAQAHAHYAAGVIADLNEQPAVALEEFYQAALADPGEDRLARLAAERCLRAGQPEKAVEILRAAIRQQKSSAALYALLGSSYAQMKRFDEAAAANRKAIALAPNALAGYRNQFLLLLETRRSKDALKLLDRAARVRQADAPFLIGLADFFVIYAQRFPTQREAVHARAERVLDRAEKLNPAHTLVRLQLADAFYKINRPERAAPHYLAVVDRLNELPQARDLVRDRLVRIFLREGDRRRAAEQLQAIVRDDPSNAQAYYLLASLAAAERRWQDMADYLRKTILFRPEFEAAYYDLASAQLALGRPEEALATLETAARKFPQNFALEFRLGLAARQLKRNTDALRHFRAAELIALTTNTNLINPAFYIQYGAALAANGDHPQARDYFQKALRLQPDSPEVWTDVAATWLELNQVEEALAVLEEADKKFPPSFVRAYLFGSAHRQRKNYPAALRHFLEAERIARERETNFLTHLFYFELGAAAERSGDYQRAEQFLEQCLRLKPDFPDAQNYLGYMWADRGENLERARALIEQAVKADPQNAAYLDSLGWVLFRLGQTEKALEYIREAIRLSPEPDATLYDHLGDIYAALGRMDEAREAWARSLSIEQNPAVQKKLDALPKP